MPWCMCAAPVRSPPPPMCGGDGGGCLRPHGCMSPHSAVRRHRMHAGHLQLHPTHACVQCRPPAWRPPRPGRRPATPPMAPEVLLCGTAVAPRYGVHMRLLRPAVPGLPSCVWACYHTHGGGARLAAPLSLSPTHAHGVRPAFWRHNTASVTRWPEQPPERTALPQRCAGARVWRHVCVRARMCVCVCALAKSKR